MDDNTGNLVSCGMDGRIRFWNIVHTAKVNKSKLLSKFRAVFRQCDGVSCIATDSQNTVLLMGDTFGYIRIYELEEYYSAYGSQLPVCRKPESHHFLKYPFLRLQGSIEQNHA
ncbi:WD repeat-containing protein 49, partial [Stegodyphus mimosarum]